MFEIPKRWTRGGLILARTDRATSEIGYSVIGDPSIVWDEEIPGWRMVMFYDPPGCGQAICRDRENVGPGQWEFQGPLVATNPEVMGWTHKPYIVTEAGRPNIAAKVEGKYWLLSVVIRKVGNNHNKFVHRAWATSLAGPWTFESEPLIPPGGPGEFDEKHTDAVSGIYFPERREFLYFYMGYPRSAQPRAISPYGNAQAAASQKVGEAHVTKLGMILPPAQIKGHWCSGYLGGVQPLPGKSHRWIALINGSPTAPVFGDGAVHAEEPPPSLGGFAYCDEEWPVKGWRFADQPMEWIEEIPAEAIANGEGVNLWRHHMLMLPGNKCAVFYNTGSYGKEQLYVKYAQMG